MMARLNIFQFLNKYVNLVLYKLVAIVCIFPLEEKHPNSNPGGEGIGNASTIDIWKDPWIPRNYTRKVADLINPATGTWDEQLVRDIFWEEDAKIILSIPLFEDMEDFPAYFQWNHLMLWASKLGIKQMELMHHPLLMMKVALTGRKYRDWMWQIRWKCLFGSWPTIPCKLKWIFPKEALISILYARFANDLMKTLAICSSSARICNCVGGSLTLKRWDMSVITSIC